MWSRKALLNVSKDESSEVSRGFTCRFASAVHHLPAWQVDMLSYCGGTMAVRGHIYSNPYSLYLLVCKLHVLP